MFFPQRWRMSQRHEKNAGIESEFALPFVLPAPNTRAE
jgi:hypothetical protein